VLLKQLGEVVILHARIGGAGQREDPGPDLLSEASGRGPATVPMGEGREALLAQADEEPADMPQREAQELGGLPGAQGAGVDSGEDMNTLLLLLGQGDRLPVHGPRVTDSLAR